ncbi:death-inducer obliterator 1-like isoform X2 [Heterocephalus glaber]|uniref:Death-inducer obliterator 1-like isoform X2 n=1 Tax=Heterocephalus glaber TaxID=10181 RepID=A0AAX6SQT6_HETGA|nr:death-inducer obliterator 1-like isoform X2 [Heterocephalus glaber]
MEDPGDESNADAPEALSPMREEFWRTGGIRRTMITQQEGAGNTEADPARQQPLSPSLQHRGRRPKRPQQVGEPQSTGLCRGGDSLAVSLEGSGEPASRPGSPVHSALEGRSESSSETKCGPAPGSECVKPRGRDEQGDSADSDIDGFTGEGLQNRLPRKPEQESAERAPKGVCSGPRKPRPEEEPSKGVEVQAGSAGRKGPPCRQDPEAARGSDREWELEAVAVQGPGDKDPGDPGKPGPECEVSAPSALCRQPHSNRLVICPDHGEECFRVHCVGISEPPGCLLERNGADHVDLNGTALQAQERTSEAPDAQGPGCRSGGAGVTQGKSRRACRRKSRADQRSRSESEETSSPRGEEAMEMSPPVTVAPGTVPCACPGCSNMAQPDTVYCCNDCLLRHAATAMRLLSVHKKHKPKPKKKKKKVRMKPEKLCLPKPSVQAGMKMSSVHERPAPEEAEPPAKKVTVTPLGSDSMGKAAASESSTPSRAGDHKCSAVTPEKPAAPSTPCWGQSPKDHRRVEDRVVGAASGPKETALPGSSGGRQPLCRSLATKKARPFVNKAAAKPAVQKSSSGFRGPIPKGPWLGEAPAGPSAARPAGPMPVPLASNSKKSPCSAASMGATRKPVVPLVPTASPAPGCLRPVGPALSQPESQLRQIIRHSLKEILWKRVCESGDLIRTENEVGKTAIRLEEEMFNLFRVTDHRYRSKYRSIMLRLKDPASQGLFHRVVREEISLEELVRMKPEELVSKELSTCKDGLTKSQESICTVHTKITVPLPDPLSSMLEDTTSQHRAHLFDLNCKMCTGQVLSEDEPAPKKQKLSPSAKKLDLTSKPRSAAPDPVPHLSEEGSALTLPKDASEPHLERASGPTPERNISESWSPRIGGKALPLSHLSSIWKGLINMQSVGKFVTKACPVSGNSVYLGEDLPDTIHIGGRIAPKTVWDYVGKLKSSVSKELCLIRFHPATWEEEGTYISLYSYFRSCGHFGVVANTNRRIKDLYLIPLSAGDPVPPRLLPLAGPGLESPRPNLLLGLVISEKQKRLPDTGELDKMREKQTPLDAPGCPSLPAAPQPKRKPPKSQLCSAAEGSPPPLLPLPEPPVLKTLSSLLPVATCSVTTPTTAVPVPLAASPVTLRPSDPASPLHFILRTLFKGTSFQAPPQDPAGLTPTPQQDRKAQAQEGASGVLLLDPIVQQFGHFMDSGPQEEEEEDDRLYNPEEGYNMQPAFDPWLAERGKWQDGGKALDASEEAAVAYDPEDETFLEAANVTVADLPNVMCADLRERPGEHTRYWPPPAWGHQRIWEDLKSSLAKAELLPQEHRALDQSQGALGTNHTSYSGLSRDPQQARHLGESSRYEALARAPWW